MGVKGPGVHPLPQNLLGGRGVSAAYAIFFLEDGGLYPVPPSTAGNPKISTIGKTQTGGPENM